MTSIKAHPVTSPFSRGHGALPREFFGGPDGELDDVVMQMLGRLPHSHLDA